MGLLYLTHALQSPWILTRPSGCYRDSVEEVPSSLCKENRQCLAVLTAKKRKLPDMDICLLKEVLE